MNTVDVLRRAKEILSDPERWNREGGFGRLPNGAPAETIGQFPEAVSFCAVGAIARQFPGGLGIALDDEPAVRALAVAVGVSSWIGVTLWNDRKATHEALIDAFDRAILSLTAGLEGPSKTIIVEPVEEPLPREVEEVA